MGYPTSMLPEVHFILFMATHSCISKWSCTLCHHDCNNTSQTAPHHRLGSKQVEVLSGCFTSFSLFLFSSPTRTQAGAEPLVGESLLYGIPVKVWESTLRLNGNCCFQPFGLVTLRSWNPFFHNGLSHLSFEQNSLMWLQNALPHHWLKVTEVMHCYLEGAILMYMFLFFSLSSIHQGVPGDASSVFIRNIVRRLLILLTLGSLEQISIDGWLCTVFVCFSHIGPGHRDRVCITLEPAQLLKGDIMVKKIQQNFFFSGICHCWQLD